MQVPELKNNQIDMEQETRSVVDYIEDIGTWIPEYLTAEEKRAENEHWMCRYYAHHVKCPFENQDIGMQCRN